MKMTVVDGKQFGRISWIDITKGLAIILVVIGHSIQSFGKDQDVLLRVIYSFHMPVFFVISGYTFKLGVPFKKFLQKKAKLLLLPYIGFALITSLYEVLLSIFKGNVAELLIEFRASALATILVTSNSFFVNLWFLPTLFIALMLIYFIFHSISNELLRGGGIAYLYQ